MRIILILSCELSYLFESISYLFSGAFVLKKLENFDFKKFQKFQKIFSRQTESIFYMYRLSWEHLAGFNYMVESLMSHEAFEENGRCIPFTLDPEHKKKAIALHDQNYTQQVIIRNFSRLVNMTMLRKCRFIQIMTKPRNCRSNEF